MSEKVSFEEADALAAAIDLRAFEGFGIDDLVRYAVLRGWPDRALWRSIVTFWLKRGVVELHDCPACAKRYCSGYGYEATP